MTSSLVGANGGSGTKRNMSADAGNGCRGQRRRAASQGLLPVPSPVTVADAALYFGRCRSVRRRRERLAHWRAWHASGFRTMNELCCGRAIPSRRDPSRVQTFLCNNLERAHVDVGRPPGDLTAAGALGDLSAVYALAITMTSVVFACHFSQVLPPYRVPGRHLLIPSVV